MRKRSIPCLLLAIALCLCLGASNAQAQRTLITKEAIKLIKPQKPSEELIPGEQIEGACGLAFSGQSLLVSDYYHAMIETYAPEGGGFSASKPFKLSSVLSLGTSPPEAACQIATGPGGTLYANVWHQSAIRVKPTFQTFDVASSTGVAVDAAGKVYVNDRTQVNVYSAAGVLLQEVGLGNLKDAYGLAVFGKALYVPDAGTNTIKVFEPETDPLNPKQTIDGSKTPQKRFVSLVDTAIGIDPTNGHLLVLDNLQPGFERPEGAIDEFDAEGAFVSQLKEKVIDGGPSGLVVDPETGRLFVSSGNSEESNVFAWGGYVEGGGGAVGGELEGTPAVAQSAASSEAGAPTSPTSSVGSRSEGAAGQDRRAKRRRQRNAKHRKALQVARRHPVAP